jgi:hypothetical protein
MVVESVGFWVFQGFGAGQYRARERVSCHLPALVDIRACGMVRIGLDVVLKTIIDTVPCCVMRETCCVMC